MPSSPGPTDFQRRSQRFLYKGISLLPQDLINDSGKAAFAVNIRSYQPGTFTVRFGTSRAASNAAPAALHSIFRLDDPTPLGVGNVSTRIVGAADGGLYRQVVGAAIGAQIDAGYSGNPLTAVVTAPLNSPQPFAYIGDTDRSRKVASDGTVSQVGLAPPTLPPTAALAEPQLTDLDFLMEDGDWTPYGGETVPLAPDLAPIIDRVDTVLTQFLFDDGASGMASASLESFENVTAGMLVNVGAERVIVQEVHPPVSPTTIAAILYDSGNTGLCTIQPDGSFSVGQVEAPDPDTLRHRYQGLSEPLPPQVTVTRTIDYPVNSLVTLGGSEVVRIISVAVGTDGVQSFRCLTLGTFAAGATIEGLPSFRAWFAAAHAISEVVQVSATQIEATALDEENPIVAGVQTALPNVDWGRVGTRATQPEDIIRLGIRISLMGFVQSVRLVLDVDNPTGSPANEFLRNYYFYEWRASDLISAIQASGEVATNQVFEAQAGAVEQGQVDQAYADQYGYAGLPGNRRSPGAPTFRNPEDPVDPDTLASPGAVPRDGLVSIGSGLSRQLALGNDVWITLECRVGDLSRVGTDTTLTLGDINDAVVYAQIVGTMDPVTLSFSDPYLTGGYGPDAGPTLPPYVYRYRYRCSATGARSNPSPTMRAGMPARRNRVDLTWTPSSDPQVNLVDVFRLGGALARWAYVASFPNGDGAAADDMADGQIDGGETIRVDLFQPWPTSDIPRSGTCRVVGTAVEWISGDAFNTNWSADSAIIINGRTTQLYGPPSSATRLEVIDNCGEGDPVEFTLPAPTILATPMPAIWGGPINNVWFTFAAGDPNDPSALHWTFGNDSETTSDAFVLFLSSPSEPLLNGCFNDGFPYAFSSERLYRIVPTFGDITTFRTQETACTRGLWSRWAFCDTPYGIAFLSKDGIYLTQGGSEPVSITNPDLQMLFPQDGGLPQTIRGLVPVDMTQADRLRLAYVDQQLYFDYVDTDGVGRTLVYRFDAQGWTPDVYPEAWGGVRVRLQEPGEGTYSVLLGMGDGFLNQMDANQIVDVDQPLPWAYWTSWEFSDDPRALKQWGDAVLDFNPGGSVNGVQVTPVIINGNTALTPVLLGIGGTERDTFIVEMEDGIGMLSRNCGLWIEGTLDACDTQRPIFYLWEPAWLFKQTPVSRRATDWENLGYKGDKFVQGVIIRANTFNVPKCVAVQYDGPNSGPQVGINLTITHNGEREIAYPREAAGWTPFVGQLVRLLGTCDVEWTLLDWRWVWEPAPELATQWETQDTTFDLPGYGSLRDAVLAYASTTPTTLRVWHDLQTIDYTLPSTGGVYQRLYTRFRSAKGKAYKFRWTGDAPFRVFKRDVSMRVQGWGRPGGYQVVMPFGGPHRVDGAEL